VQPATTASAPRVRSPSTTVRIAVSTSPRDRAALIASIARTTVRCPDPSHGLVDHVEKRNRRRLAQLREERVRRVARHRQDPGAGRLEAPDHPNQCRYGRRAVVEEGPRSIGDARVVVDDDAQVPLVNRGWRRRNDAAEELHRRRRPHASQDPDRLRLAHLSREQGTTCVEASQSHAPSRVLQSTVEDERAGDEAGRIDGKDPRVVGEPERENLERRPRSEATGDHRQELALIAAQDVA